MALLWFFVGFPIIIGLIIFIAQDQADKRKIEEENLYTLETYGYCGGNDYVATDTRVELKWRKDNVLVITFLRAGRIEYIPYSDINRVYIRTEHQIKEDVTLTRLAVMGVFAFGNKKETRSNEYYLVLSYKNCEGVEQNLILSKGMNLQKDINLYETILKEYKEKNVVK